MSLVLVPVDGSETTDRALVRLLDRWRRERDVRAALLYVQEAPARFGEVLVFQPGDDLGALAEKRGAEVLRAATERLVAAGVQVTTYSAAGDLYPTIARIATEIRPDEIVLGVRRLWRDRIAAALTRRFRPLSSLRVPVTYPS